MPYVTDCRTAPETQTAVKIGDHVCFKCDIEQSGKITAIDGDRLTLENEYGFQGAYIGGQTRTVEAASRCWIE